MGSFSLDKAMTVLKSQLKNIETEDLTAILKGVQIPGPRGEKGDPGRDAIAPVVRDGKDGLPGKDAEPINLILGTVSAGDFASAELKRNSTGYVLNLTLPRGERGATGEASQIPGIQGKSGRDGKNATQEDIEKAAADFLLKNVDKFRGNAGPAGASVKGDLGQKGDPGMTREEITQAVLEILSTAGVLQMNERLLVAIRAKLKDQMHKADARHAAHFGDLVREVDNLFEKEKEFDEAKPVTHKQMSEMMSEIIAAAVKAALEEKKS